MVKLVLASAIASRIGERGAELEFEGTVRDLLEMLVGRYGDRLTSTLYVKGRLSPYVNIYVDGKDIRYTGGLDTKVDGNSTVDFIPAIAGG
jgi:molybdopterin synthase sulfur carrier subunit